jgi:hypothetical protein
LKVSVWILNISSAVMRFPHFRQNFFYPAYATET